MTTWHAVKAYNEILFETNADGKNPGGQAASNFCRRGSKALQNRVVF